MSASREGGMAGRAHKTVVSIDDDEDFGRLLELMLKSEGVEVVQATNGEEGLRLIEDLQPDLVILDLMMPDMHGWQVFEKMQAQKRLQGIPVIIVTALSSETDLSFGLDVAGVDAYLIKPIRANEFRSLVARALLHSPDSP